jgi:hypothetical protein
MAKRLEPETWFLSQDHDIGDEFAAPDGYEAEPVVMQPYRYDGSDYCSRGVLVVWRKRAAS